MTPLNRPTDLADREYLTQEEALAMEQRRRDRQAEINARPSRRTEADPSGNVDRGIEGGPGSFNRHWFDSRRFVSPTLRTSLVVDPSNGRMPPMNLVARAKWDAENQLRKDLGLQEHEPTPGGWVEDIGHNSLQARCITGFNAVRPCWQAATTTTFSCFKRKTWWSSTTRWSTMPESCRSTGGRM